MAWKRLNGLPTYLTHISPGRREFMFATLAHNHAPILPDCCFLWRTDPGSQHMSRQLLPS